MHPFICKSKFYHSVKKEEVSTVDQEVQTELPWIVSQVKNDLKDISSSQDDDVVEFSAVADDKWCCHCDVTHSKPDECPFQKPAAVILDSVIDFSAKDSGDGR